MEDPKPPRKKRVDPQQPESVDSRRPGEERTPASAERTDDTEEAEGREIVSRQSPSGDHGPVTNQDEQEKITNADESDVPVNEK